MNGCLKAEMYCMFAPHVEELKGLRRAETVDFWCFLWNVVDNKKINTSLIL